MPKIGLFGGYTPKTGFLGLSGPDRPAAREGFYINPSRRGPAASRGANPREGGTRPIGPGARAPKERTQAGPPLAVATSLVKRLEVIAEGGNLAKKQRPMILPG